MNISLAITYHDPSGRLLEQFKRMLPILGTTFSSIGVHASPQANPRTLDLLRAVGARLYQSGPDAPSGGIGRARRLAVAQALESGSPFVLYCDGDRALHWAEQYPAELAETAHMITQFDFTVLGRTQRAFESHPRTQRDTELIFNRLFASTTGWAWDVGAGARALSPRPANVVLEGCPDDQLSTDISWLLFLQRADGFHFGYLETEGLEFETADRHAEEVAAAGGLPAWLDSLDRDPQQWLHRLEVARIEIEALIAYGDRHDGK